MSLFSRSISQAPTSAKLQIDVHLFNHTDSPQLKAVLKQGEAIMASLDALTAAVTKNTDVDQSAIVLLQGLKKKLDEAINTGDPAAVQRLADDLGQSTQKLADAVTANTPADTVPPNP